MLIGVRDILRPKGIVVFTVEAMGQGLGPGLEQQNQGLGQGLDQGLEQQEQGLGLEDELSSYALQPSGRIAHNHQYITRVILEVSRRGVMP